MTHSDSERIENLQFKGLRILRRADLPGYSTDAVLLADFARFPANARVLDIGTGTGILPLLLVGREKAASVTALEIHEDLARLAENSMALNGLHSRVTVLSIDAREVRGTLPAGSFDAAVCNPPYHAGQGRADRHQDTLSYGDMAACASLLLRNGGVLACSAPAAHLLTVCDALRETGLQPKRLRLVQAAPDRPPYLCLLEARKQGKPGLSVEAPLLLHDAPGAPTPAYRRIYHMEEQLP